MPDIRLRLRTNPELIKLNKAIGEWLEDCISSYFGEGKFEVKIQGGKIVHAYKGVVKSIDLRDLSADEIKEIERIAKGLDKS